MRHRCSDTCKLTSHPRISTQKVQNVQILHKYQKITGVLCVHFAGLILNMSGNIEISINFNISVYHMEIQFN